MYMNFQDDLDTNKKLDTEEEAARIEELKKKLYSNSSTVEAVRERGLKQHHVDIGKNWQETDEKQAILRAQQEEKDRNAKLGISSENFMHHGSTMYGHYSPAEEILSKRTTVIDTSFEKKAPAPQVPQESIGSFLSDKFADKRALETQKKLAATTIAMKYASTKMDREIYPHINKDTDVSQEDTEPSVTKNYRPDFTVTTVGKHMMNDVSTEIRPASRTEGVMPDVRFSKNTQTEETSAEVKSRHSFGVFIFIAVCIFFLGALGYTYMFLQKGSHIISPDKVEIVVTGPISVKSGEVNDFSIDVTNGNAVDLTLSDLVIQYPDGTVSAADKTQSLKNERIQLGTIKPGETVRSKASAVFFGEENVKKNINYAVEFSVPDSTSIFNATKDIAVVISGSPVTAKIINVKEITNNQELSFDIEIQSNTEEVVKNIQLQVEYPFGYKLTGSNVEPAFGNNTWNIGEIAALDTKVIRLTGKLVGTSNLEKNFRFTLGVADVKTGEMVSVLSTQDQKVLIEKPFVTTRLSIDGVSQDSRPVSYEEIIKGDVVFTNNLQTPLTDVVAEISIDGLLIDRRSIQPNGGFYRSSDDVMFWDKSQLERLASIDPGDAREISFNMSIIKSTDALLRTLRKSTATISVTIKAKRLNEKQVPEEVVSIITQELRLETDVGFQSSITRNTGPFVNTGPFPPKVNQETTYTYTGKITNTSNTVKDLMFVAKLPPNVTWKNIYSNTLATSSVSYSLGKKEIYIKIGDIPPGTGITTSAKEFSFQLGFTPTLTQVGQSPILISNLRVSGTDSFTGRTIERSLGGLTIIPTDNMTNIDDVKVVK
jgi:hypothetical protein